MDMVLSMLRIEFLRQRGQIGYSEIKSKLTYNIHNGADRSVLIHGESVPLIYHVQI